MKVDHSILGAHERKTLCCTGSFPKSGSSVARFFSMFDHPRDPQHLIDSLIAFVHSWQGIRPWYGVAAEKLGAVSLPEPLRQLYGALGNMPGSEGRPFPFWHQDRLLPFELLQTVKSRLLFAVENQGCWGAYTEPTDDDPRVWFRADQDEPELEHPSLANFLVTLCLQELTLGCPVLYAGEGLREELQSRGYRVSPLWLEGLFPAYDHLSNPHFFLVDGSALMLRDRWIGFRTQDDADRCSDALLNADRIRPRETVPISEYLSHPDRNPVAERLYYERLARDFRAQADALEAKAQECQRAAEHAMHRSGGG